MILTLPGRYFNSIKVRLEPLLKNAGVFRPLFQFHKGAIRTALRLSSLLQRPNFNSIKVRLELEGKDKLYLFITFQFHKGAIRTQS